MNFLVRSKPIETSSHTQRTNMNPTDLLPTLSLLNSYLGSKPKSTSQPARTGRFKTAKARRAMAHASRKHNRH